MKLLEAHLLIAVRKVLAVYEARGKLIYRRINSGPVIRGNFSRGTGKFSRNPAAGVSDLIIWINGGPVICAELKSKRGYQSKEQRVFEGQLKKMGHHYVIWRSIDEAISLLERFCGKLT